MAATSRIKRPVKPTVFLSHSSTNRRELLGLKRLLDERAGGLIDFFLSSDDDSITHGTIWPAEVRAALDRMTLMLIFVSSEALKSGWTYFEAGYGLHKLGSAKIYCLPGSDKGSLPSPFNILQNRNLHSARDIGLLIKQCNEALGARLKENISQEEFDRIFKRPLTVKLETGPSFESLVENMTVSVTGPFNSSEIFSKVCQRKGFAVSPVSDSNYFGRDVFVSTGLRLSIERPDLEGFLDELPISKKARRIGSVKVEEGWPTKNWSLWDEEARYHNGQLKTVSIAEVEAHNEKCRDENDERRKRNNALNQEPRKCKFELAPTNISVPVGIIDDWLVAAKTDGELAVEIKLRFEVQCESRIETITAKIHGSELCLRSDGNYQWGDHAILNIHWLKKSIDRDLKLSPLNGSVASVSEFRVQELIATLSELEIISALKQRNSARRK